MSGPNPDSTDGEHAATPDEHVAKPQIARDAIAGAAEILGGAEGLAAWAKVDTKNEDKFWTTLYPKLIPLQVPSDTGGPIRIAAAIEAARKRVQALARDRDSDGVANEPR